MAEITNLFKATVKTVKARNKQTRQTLGTESHSQSQPDRSILGKTSVSRKNPGEFESRSKEVVSDITQLKDFLTTHRKDYVNAFSQIGKGSTQMTDSERDQIDADAETYMRLCSDAIKNIKLQEQSSKCNSQVRDHRNGVLSLLDTYLKFVCRSYSEQRAIRVKRVVDKKRISRLEPEKKVSQYETPETSTDTSKSNGEPPSLASDDEKKKQTKEYYSRMLSSSKTEESDFSPEELQMFEQENQQLYQDMNSMVDEVKQIEGKVVEISRLQEIFSEKVLDQEKDIDRIAGTVVGTTENIREANEEIREAMKNNAGLRVWILFILTVCTFSLLFLDWYNA